MKYTILVRKRARNSNHIDQWKVHICSENNFPTAAGLASSAAGYACLVAALAKLYQVEVLLCKVNIIMIFIILYIISV